MQPWRGQSWSEGRAECGWRRGALSHNDVCEVRKRVFETRFFLLGSEGAGEVDDETYVSGIVFPTSSPGRRGGIMRHTLLSVWWTWISSSHSVPSGICGRPRGLSNGRSLRGNLSHAQLHGSRRLTLEAPSPSRSGQEKANRGAGKVVQAGIVGARLFDACFLFELRRYVTIDPSFHGRGNVKLVAAMTRSCILDALIFHSPEAAYTPTTSLMASTNYRASPQEAHSIRSLRK